MNIYAVPYAGGNISIYTNLKKYLTNEINVVPLEMSGHGSRIGEMLYYSIKDIANDIVSKIVERDTDSEYALLGYSMGGLVCLEMLAILNKKGKNLPSRVFLCASSIPEGRFENIRNFNEQELMEIIQNFGGTPDELWLNNELKDLILPIFRADLIAIAEYIPTRVKSLENSRICLIYTNDEHESISLWEKFVIGPYDTEYISYQHFFIFEKYHLLGDIIKKYLIRDNLDGR